MDGKRNIILKESKCIAYLCYRSNIEVNFMGHYKGDILQLVNTWDKGIVKTMNYKGVIIFKESKYIEYWAYTSIIKGNFKDWKDVRSVGAGFAHNRTKHSRANVSIECLAIFHHHKQEILQLYVIADEKWIH